MVMGLKQVICHCLWLRKHLKIGISASIGISIHTICTIKLVKTMEVFALKHYEAQAERIAGTTETDTSTHQKLLRLLYIIQIMGK
jgi:hypothetical protein